MPRELQEAPAALSPRREIDIDKEMKESVQRREDVITTGRIAQLETENQMLRD